MSVKKVTILGASGTVAKETVKAFESNGFELTLFSRGIEAASYPSHNVVKGDVFNSDDLDKAIQGNEAIHVTLGKVDEEKAMEHIVKTAKMHHVKWISYVSGATVAEENAWFPMIGQKVKAEKILKESGIPYIIFRPTYFMDVLPMFIQNGKANLMGKQPLKLHMLAGKDFGKLVVSAYQKPEALNNVFYAYGPETLTLNEALAKYIKVKHPEIKKVSNAPFGLLKGIAFLTDNKQLKELIPMFQYFEKTKEVGDSTLADTILGKTEITLDQWLS